MAFENFKKWQEETKEKNEQMKKEKQARKEEAASKYEPYIKERIEERKFAKKLYYAYGSVTTAIAEKTNGVILAAQEFKLEQIRAQNETIINQNKEIIELLKIMANK